MEVGLYLFRKPVAIGLNLLYTVFVTIFCGFSQ